MDPILKCYPDIEDSANLPSYVEAFFNEVPKQVHFLHRRTLDSDSTNYNYTFRNGECKFDASSPDFDVTGSPLKCTIYSVQLNDSNVLPKECWSKEEAAHAPIPLNEARIILSKYLCFSSDCHVPLWIACNGHDVFKTLLLCGYKEDGWCLRNIVYYEGMIPVSSVNKKSHITDVLSWNSRGNVEINCVFNVLEMKDFETSNFSFDSTSAPNCKKAHVYLTWQYPSIKVPIKDVSALFSAELEVGHGSSIISPLWEQLQTIMKYMEALNTKITHLNDILPNVIKSENEANQNTVRKILKIIYKGENTMETLDHLKIDKDCKSERHKFLYLINQILACQHSGSDAADRIWLLLNEREEVQEIAVCLNEVLASLGKQPQRAHAILRKNILLNTIFAAHLSGNLPVTELSLKKTLEIMIETGLEKLKEDYTYIFKYLGVECEKYFKKLSSMIESSFVEYNIRVLVQLHVTLDFIIAGQKYLDISGINLSALARNVLNQCIDKVSSLNVLKDNSPLSVEVPISSECVVNNLPVNFLRMKIKNSSNDLSERKYETVLITSRSIFPPSFFKSDAQVPENGSENENLEESTVEEESYYIYRLLHICDLVY